MKTDGEVVLFRDGGEGPMILARTWPLPGMVRALPALAGSRLDLRDDRNQPLTPTQNGAFGKARADGRARRFLMAPSPGARP